MAAAAAKTLTREDKLAVIGPQIHHAPGLYRRQNKSKPLVDAYGFGLVKAIDPRLQAPSISGATLRRICGRTHITHLSLSSRCTITVHTRTSARPIFRPCSSYRPQAALSVFCTANYKVPTPYYGARVESVGLARRASLLSFTAP